MRVAQVSTVALVAMVVGLFAIPAASAENPTIGRVNVQFEGPAFKLVGGVVGEVENTYDWVRENPPDPNNNITKSYFCIYTDFLAPGSLPVQETQGGIAIGVPLEATTQGDPMGGGDAQFVSVSTTGEAPCDPI